MTREHPVNMTPADAQTVIRALRFYAEHPEYNDDTEAATDTLSRIKTNLSSVYGKIVNIPEPRNEDWTMMELFPDDGLFQAQQSCEECGALVPYERARQIHVTWHNKLLP